MMDLTTEEKLIVQVCRANKSVPKKEINKKWVIGRLHITFNWRSKNNLWGRFGGGWQWELGFQASSTTVILNLLVFSLRFYWKKD